MWSQLYKVRILIYFCFYKNWGDLMQYFAFSIYMSELKHQCELAAMAYDDINKGLEQQNTNLVWYSVQNFLISVGNISKVLFPTKKGSLSRGEYIREALGINDDSLFKSRKFRNHFEHFDERIEAWINDGDHSIFIDKTITDKDNLMNDESLESKYSMRHLITDGMILKFRGDRYELEPIALAVVELYKEINIAEAEMRRREMEKYR